MVGFAILPPIPLRARLAVRVPTRGVKFAQTFRKLRHYAQISVGTTREGAGDHWSPLQNRVRSVRRYYVLVIPKCGYFAMYLRIPLYGN